VVAVEQALIDRPGFCLAYLITDFVVDPLAPEDAGGDLGRLVPGRTARAGRGHRLWRERLG